MGRGKPLPHPLLLGVLLFLLSSSAVLTVLVRTLQVQLAEADRSERIMVSASNMATGKDKQASTTPPPTRSVLQENDILSNILSSSAREYIPGSTQRHHAITEAAIKCLNWAIVKLACFEMAFGIVGLMAYIFTGRELFPKLGYLPLTANIPKSFELGFFEYLVEIFMGLSLLVLMGLNANRYTFRNALYIWTSANMLYGISVLIVLPVFQIMNYSPYFMDFKQAFLEPFQWIPLGNNIISAMLIWLQIRWTMASLEYQRILPDMRRPSTPGNFQSGFTLV